MKQSRQYMSLSLIITKTPSDIQSYSSFVFQQNSPRSNRSSSIRSASGAAAPDLLQAEGTSHSWSAEEQTTDLWAEHPDGVLKKKKRARPEFRFMQMRVKKGQAWVNIRMWWACRRRPVGLQAEERENRSDTKRNLLNKQTLSTWDYMWCCR